MTTIQEDVVNIYRNRKTGEFRIQPFARATHSSQPFGEQTAIKAQDAATTLLKSVLQNLSKNTSQKYVKELMPRISDEEFRRSLAEDQLVSVVRSQGKYRIMPFKKMGKSMGSVDELEVSVSEEKFLQRGMDLIEEAFSHLL